ncbi:MAG: response regulator [candidate division NC10 bacterium]|nr:response regulator [candidate division NC10 bacterium]
METVFVVDDDRVIQERTADLLLGEGYGVVKGGLAGEVLKRIREGGVDLLLLDQVLPDSMGTDLLPFITELDPELPVVIITGYASVENAIEALQKGAYDYLQKPFHPETLLGMVRRGLEKRRADLQNRQLLLQLSQKINELLVLQQVGETISSTLDLTQILNSILAATKNVTNSEACSLLLLDQEAGQLTFEVALGEKWELLKGFQLEKGQGIAGWVAIHERPLIVNEARADPRFFKEVDRITSFVTERILAVPLSLRGKTIGVLEALNKQSGPYLEEDLNLLRAIASQASVAIENARLYQRVVQQLEDLKALEVMKDHLLQFIVHDLKNPLTGVALYLEMLKRAKAKPEGVALDDARRGCRTLMNMIGDLLDISKLEEGRLLLRKGLVDLEQIVRENVAEFSIVADDEEKQLMVECQGPLPSLAVDRDLLYRVVGNLLSNAIRYSFSGGEIRVRIHRPSGDLLQVDVMDQGEGIPEEEQEKIFGKFWQAGSGSARRGGLGLGLTFCKMAVEAHGGRIWVESQPGRGSTFSFTLPLLEGGVPPPSGSFEEAR